MAEFKVGDKVVVISGGYPAGYLFPQITPSEHQIGMVGHVERVDADYPAGYIPDYRVEFETGGFERIDEVHLVLVTKEPDQYVVDSALALHAFEILERIEAKLTELDQRLAAHEARANQTTILKVSVPVEVEAPAIQAKPIICPWLDMHDKELILTTFKLGDKVEFTQGNRWNCGRFIGYIQGFDASDDDQFLDIVWDQALNEGSRWPDLSVRKVRKVIE